jgi:hypothetical protein
LTRIAWFAPGTLRTCLASICIGEKSIDHSTFSCSRSSCPAGISTLLLAPQRMHKATCRRTAPPQGSHNFPLEAGGTDEVLCDRGWIQWNDPSGKLQRIPPAEHQPPCCNVTHLPGKIYHAADLDGSRVGLNCAGEDQRSRLPQV